MPVAKELLDVLVCPACKRPVVLNQKQDGLRCSVCRVTYPIVDDIPVMLVGKAIKD